LCQAHGLRRAEGLAGGQGLGQAPAGGLGDPLGGGLADAQAGQARQGVLGGLGEAGQQAGQADDLGGRRGQVVLAQAQQGVARAGAPVALLAEVVMPPQAQRAEQADNAAGAQALAAGVLVVGGGRSCWSPGTPFFPLVQSGLQGLGSQAVDRLADLELRGAEELRVGLGGEQACEAAGLVQEGLLEGLEEALGFGFLLGGQVGFPDGSRGGVCGCVATADDPTRFPAPFRDAYPSGCHCRVFAGINAG
jgi:hypothetical protein